ncbi:MAG TPA: glycoside hydrolase family 3 N-terminal domain-containing protein [Gemmatimonadales bacterium]|nr:glycoside hydrolase family 3 N-terminal domain-containing protein [Gemmatimonadales bacterium]
MHLKYLVIVVVSLWACGPSTPVAPPQPAQFPPDAGAPVLDIDALISTLSLRDKVAQLVMPWIAGTYAATDDPEFARTLAWVDSLHVGGLLISVGSPLDIAAKLNQLQQHSSLPLLIGSDLESGTSFRFVGGTPFPPNMGVAAGEGEKAAYDIGRITAVEARAVGIHITFSPVADVNSNPANPIINLRSFGEDPKAVGRLVAAAVQGIQDNGVLSAVKHFPGHGDTDLDTHLDLPATTAGWPRLDSVELVPFRAAIDAGVSGVMSAHVAVPALDRGVRRPATLSPAVQTSILRDSLGFRGLVITDALNMGSLVRNYPAAKVAVDAFLAGADILLQPGDPAATIDAVTAAVRDGRITRERLDRSVRRLLQTKRDLGLFVRRTAMLDSITALVGRAEYTARAQEIATDGIVLAEDRYGVVDSLRSRAQPVALVSYGDDRSPNAGVRLAAELRARGYPVTSVRLFPSSGAASYDSARTVLAQGHIAVFAIGIRPSPWHLTGITLPAALSQLIDSTAAAGPAVLVSEGTPYMISETPSVTSYVLAWAADPITERAVGRALSGVTGITGRLPISIPPRYSRGWGVHRRLFP